MFSLEPSWRPIYVLVPTSVCLKTVVGRTFAADCHWTWLWFTGLTLGPGPGRRPGSQTCVPPLQSNVPMLLATQHIMSPWRDMVSRQHSQTPVITNRGGSVSGWGSSSLRHTSLCHLLSSHLISSSSPVPSLVFCFSLLQSICECVTSPTTQKTLVIAVMCQMLLATHPK
jgi:hypothetical protein